MQDTIRIRIGNQTAFMASSPLEPFQYAVENRFDAFEWFPDKKESGAGWDIYDIPQETRRQIKETARSHDIMLTVHAPWWTNPLTPEAQEILDNQIDFAKNIGADLLNVHLSIESGVEAFAEALVPAIKATEAAGLQLSIENTPVTVPEDFNQLFTLLQSWKDLPTGHVGMCLDLGHANLCDATRNDYIRYIDLLGTHVPIIHVHMHENYGDHDSHLPIFTGPAGENDAGVRAAMERLVRRGFSGAIILEQWPEPHSLLLDARERLQAIAGSYLPNREKQAVPTKTALRKKKQVGPMKEDETPPPKTAPPKKTAVAASKKEDKGRFVKALVAMNKKRSSWREKLDGVSTILADEAFVPSTENLIYLAIYLRFLGTGEISTTEDGRHYRPSHHARLAQQITEKLTALTTPDNAFIIRKIYPWLPSFDTPFTRAEPLTRIRDIAHRNDIPQELKKEIKHTLQNKLHRCAGPEDLVTSEKLLKRITANEGEYPAPFVEQFTIFHGELQEFFNAGSLEMRLEKIFEEEGLGELAQRFVAEKKGRKDDAGKQLQMLELATELRAKLLETAGSEASASAQNMRLADIGLEDFEFMLLSGLIAKLEKEKKIPWQLSLKAGMLILANLKQSALLPELSGAIAAGLGNIADRFNPDEREHLLKLKASLTRCLRLAETYSDLVLSLFLEKANRLGRDLRVDELAIKTYCEGDIRGNLIFQLSKLAALLIKRIKKAAALPPWDVIVAGNAHGKLVSAKHLDTLKAPAVEELVVLLDKAEGDETVPDKVAAIILAHELPHLSHLAIRTRQDGVILVATEEKAQINAVKKLKGKRVRLNADDEAVTIKASTAKRKSKKASNAPTRSVSLPAVELTALSSVVELEQVSMTTGGGKAYGSQLLRTLARRPDAGFSTPRGVVIPFGVMEEALSATPAVRAQYDGLMERLNHLDGADFRKTLKELAAIVSTLPVPKMVVKAILQKFPQNARLMVRSSSNSEDLESMAGAGLYESVANVPPDQIDEAVRTVWTSLWTERAALSRKQASIPHYTAHMAVLIQQMVVPDYSFVMHTVNPINRKKSEIYVELAVGLGEILASASVPGTPYRMVLHKKTGALNMLAFADFSVALRPGKQGEVTASTVDYSKMELTNDEQARQALGKRLAAIGRFIEETYGRPQDIEGAVVGETIVLLQARPQQGIK